MLRTALSIVCMGTIRSDTDCFRFFINVSLTISMSTPAVTDFSAASFSFAQNPWFIISATDVQSVTTMPSYFHSSRRMFFSMNLLAVEGTPSLSLNEVIKVAHPISAAALKGGK